MTGQVPLHLQRPHQIDICIEHSPIAIRIGYSSKMFSADITSKNMFVNHDDFLKTQPYMLKWMMASVSAIHQPFKDSTVQTHQKDNLPWQLPLTRCTPKISVAVFSAGSVWLAVFVIYVHANRLISPICHPDSACS